MTALTKKEGQRPIIARTKPRNTSSYPQICRDRMPQKKDIGYESGGRGRCLSKHGSSEPKSPFQP